MDKEFSKKSIKRLEKPLDDIINNFKSIIKKKSEIDSTKNSKRKEGLKLEIEELVKKNKEIDSSLQKLKSLIDSEGLKVALAKLENLRDIYEHGSKISTIEEVSSLPVTTPKDKVEPDLEPLGDQSGIKSSELAEQMAQIFINKVLLLEASAPAAIKGTPVESIVNATPEVVSTTLASGIITPMGEEKFESAVSRLEFSPLVTTKTSEAPNSNPVLVTQEDALRPEINYYHYIDGAATLMLLNEHFGRYLPSKILTYVFEGLLAVFSSRIGVDIGVSNSHLPLMRAGIFIVKDLIWDGKTPATKLIMSLFDKEVSNEYQHEIKLAVDIGFGGALSLASPNAPVTFGLSLLHSVAQYSDNPISKKEFWMPKMVVGSIAAGMAFISKKDALFNAPTYYEKASAALILFYAYELASKSLVPICNAVVGIASKSNSDVLITTEPKLDKEVHEKVRQEADNDSSELEIDYTFGFNDEF
jgi:hypothetical protein